MFWHTFEMGVTELNCSSIFGSWLCGLVLESLRLHVDSFSFCSLSGWILRTTVFFNEIAAQWNKNLNYVCQNRLTSSRLKRTPPIGAPNATDTPTAAAADNTCTHNRSNMSMQSSYTKILTMALSNEHNFGCLLAQHPSSEARFNFTSINNSYFYYQYVIYH